MLAQPFPDHGPNPKDLDALLADRPEGEDFDEIEDFDDAIESWDVGRRKFLMIGAACVGLTSLLAAYSTSAETQIATRALLGVSAATLMPSTLALISNMFHDPQERGRAIAVWASCFMAGTALGPVVGGALLEYFWWGSVFLLGVPIMVILAPILLPEYRDAGAGKVDLPSVALSLGTILPVIYGLKELATYGWDPLAAGAVLVGLVVGTLFVSRQRKLESPLLDLRLFSSASFSFALAVLLVSMVAMGGFYLFTTGYFQMVEGLSPMEAGLWMVPSAIASIISAQIAPTLLRRLPLGLVIGMGLGIGAVGYVLIAFVDPIGGLPLLVAGSSSCSSAAVPPGRSAPTWWSAPPRRRGADPPRRSPRSAVTWVSPWASRPWAASAAPSTAARSRCPRGCPRKPPGPPGTAWRAPWSRQAGSPRSWATRRWPPPVTRKPVG
ncbi:MFS transporter [Streptomyces sp. NPDC054874]